MSDRLIDSTDRPETAEEHAHYALVGEALAFIAELRACAATRGAPTTAPAEGSDISR